MPIPRSVARVNRRFTNQILGRAAPWLPGFGIVVHRGRRSGTSYRTPVNVFRRSGSYLFALTYGADSDWVRNVLAAGGCELITRGKRLRLVQPERFSDDQRRDMPIGVRQILALARVNEFLRMRVATPDAA